MRHIITIALGAAGVAGGATAQAPERYHPFQQDVTYEIEAHLDSATHVLTGRARIRYTNHSGTAIERLVFHQYLNAFRPNSAWARRDLRAGRTTFQELGPDDHAFERITELEVDGVPLEPLYPGSPDSTVFFVPLPRPLAPGGSVEAVIDWRARLSTEPRRQGREGRHHNWAHWYPRIAFFGADGWEYRRHVPAGEFNGTFARYDVTLDLPADQVVGATGVPVSGDPGWEAAMVDASDPPRYLRDRYGDPGPAGLGLLAGDPAAGRKRVRWVAEDVHNFAWSTSPDYRYRGDQWRETPIHLLWEPTSEGWDADRVMAQQKAALDWMAELFGEYAWPQITVVDRVESGATEFPMLYMTTGGAVLHETLHMVAHGMLANNEWRSGWLDEGMADFLGAWRRVSQGADPERVWGHDRDQVARLDLQGRTAPVGQSAAEFATYRQYSTMTYDKGALVLRMLRDLLGEATFREALRTYYERFRFRNVTREDFQRVMEEVSGRELDWFFHQWLDTTHWLDYRVDDVTVSSSPEGPVVTVRISRSGRAWMPVVVQAGDARTVVESRDRNATITLRPTERPDTVIVDPDGSLLDVDRSNNRYPLD